MAVSFVNSMLRILEFSSKSTLEFLESDRVRVGARHRKMHKA